MNALDRWVVLLNSAMAAVAFLVNVRAARRSPEPWSTVRLMVATLAGLYSAAYAWLAIHPHLILAWSQVMRGVSLLSWPVVWIVPAIVNLRSIKATRRIVERIEKETDR